MKKIILSTIYFLECIFYIHAQTLYGTTLNGGNEGGGTINKFTPATNTLDILKSFGSSTSETNPAGSLVKATDGKLYGLTVNGGSSSVGAIFSFDPSSSTFTQLTDYNNVNGPSGSAFIEVPDASPLPVTLISFTGKNNGNSNQLS